MAEVHDTHDGINYYRLLKEVFWKQTCPNSSISLLDQLEYRRMSAERELTEREGNLKTLLILFPDVRTTGGPSKLRDEGLALTATEEKFINVTTKLISRYKKLGFKIIYISHQDTTNENFSLFYPQDLHDEFIHLQQPLTNWKRQRYQDELKDLVKNLGLSKNSITVIGGYHATDCVAAAAGAIRKANHTAIVDLRLTDALPFLLLSHLERKLIYDANSQTQNLRIWEMKKEEVEKAVKRRQLGSLV